MTRTQRRPERKSALPQGRFELKDWHCIAVFAILTIAFFRNILLARDFFWEDFLYLGLPQWSFAATAFASGHLPLWNPYTFNGMPFLADLSNAVLYAPNLLLVLFVSSGRLNYYWPELLMILHYVLAGSAMYFLARSLNVRRPAALFAGSTYMLTGPMITQAIHLSVTANAAWLPLTVLLFRKSMGSPEWKWVFLAALVLAETVLIGFPQISLYVYSLLFLLFLFELLTSYGTKRILSGPGIHLAVRAAAVVGLSVLLAAIQLIPSNELAGLSRRAQITYENSSEGSLAWSQLLTLIFPRLFGTASAGGYNYWGPGTYWCFWETCIYLGIIPLMLMLVSVLFTRKNKYVLFFLLTAVLAVAYSLGNNFFLHRFLFDTLPGFSRFRVPGRAGILFTFSAVILSAFALDVLFGDLPAKMLRTVRTTLLAVTAGAALLWILVISGALSDTLTFMSNRTISALVRRDANTSILLVVVSSAAILAFLYRRIRGTAAVAVLIGLFFVDVTLFGGEQNDGKVNPAEYFRRSERLVEFIKKEGESEYFRVNTRNSQGMIMDRNQGMIDHFFVMEGYGPLVLQRLYAPMSGDKLFDLLNIKYKTVTDERTRTLAFVPNPTYLPRAFFVYRVRVAHSEDDLIASLNSPQYDHRSTALLEEDPGVILPAPVDTPVWRAQITHYDINTIALSVQTSSPGFLILSETFYPGWKASVDGEPKEIFRTDYTLRGIVVPAGTHTVSFEFSPDSFLKGALVSGGALAVCIAGLLIPVFRRKAESAPARPDSRT